MQGAIGIIVVVDCLLRILFDEDDDRLEFIRDDVHSTGITGLCEITTASARESGGIVNA